MKVILWVALLSMPAVLFLTWATSPASSRWTMLGALALADFLLILLLAIYEFVNRPPEVIHGIKGKRIYVPLFDVSNFKGFYVPTEPRRPFLFEYLENQKLPEKPNDHK